jgi:hypothetical protein
MVIIKLNMTFMMLDAASVLSVCPILATVSNSLYILGWGEAESTSDVGHYLTCYTSSG